MNDLGRASLRARPRAGFSLIEVLVALLILGVGLVGITEGITFALRSSKEAEYQTAASLLARGRLELLRTEKYVSEGETTGDFGAEFPLYAWRENVTESASKGLYHVTITVELAETGEPVYELETLFFEVPFSSIGDDALPDDAKRRQRTPRGERGKP